MSFSFHRSDPKKDEEETPAREGDPLLPQRRSGLRYSQEQHRSSSSRGERSSSSSGGLRARRSPVQSNYNNNQDTTSLSQSIQSSQNNNFQPVGEDSQMGNAGDDPTRTPSTVIDAANAAAAATAFHEEYHSEQISTHYVDLLSGGSPQEQEQTQENTTYSTNALHTPMESEQDESSSHPHLRFSENHSQPQHQRDSSPPSSSSFNNTKNNAGIQHHNFSPQQQQPNLYSSPDDNRSTGDHSGSQSQPPPLLEIPEEIYAVRKSALKVLKPMTKTWIVVSIGFSLTVLFGMARWTQLLPTAPYWFILLPSWASHVALLWLHVLSAKALSRFIAEANNSRQRPDSRDHLNRTEYLPLLQRSLKFGLKTGVISFFTFVFEILIFMKLARNTISLTAAFVPLWLLVLGGIIDGLICKSQHFLRVICWMLAFASMILLVLKIDYGYETIRWRIVVFPVVAVLSVASGSLIYIVYGHQIGFYRLTDAQLTAGNLYALAALMSIILVVIICEVIPLERPVEIETRMFVVILAPLIVCLTGMGAWVVSRDEFSRLLLYGGQSAVHPKKLRWVAGSGWACVQGKGVSVIPMFGEVSYQPLDRNGSIASTALELCACCSGRNYCYPYEEDEENNDTDHRAANHAFHHPYLLDASSKGNRGSYVRH